MVEAELVAARNPVVRQLNLCLKKNVWWLYRQVPEISKLLETARKKLTNFTERNIPGILGNLIEISVFSQL
jgi:hypothetical protein